jgi:non-canonical (house-cleaning) NTP pyrophosphatase
MIRLVVASKNPVKTSAVRQSFERVFPGAFFEVTEISVPSGVSDPDFWIGIEGGVENAGTEMHCFAWAVVHSKEMEGKARTGTFLLPPEIASLVRQGVELGTADDIVFKRANSKQQSGAVGLLTDNRITRTTYYIEALTLALIPFTNKELY